MKIHEYRSSGTVFGRAQVAQSREKILGYSSDGTALTQQTEFVASIVAAAPSAPLQRRDTGQYLALHPLQKRAACGGHKAEAGRDTGLVQRGNGISAARHRYQ